MTTLSSKFDLGQEVWAATATEGVRRFRIGAIQARVATEETRSVAEFTTSPVTYYEMLEARHYRLHDERDVFLTEEEASAHAIGLRERHIARLVKR